MKLLSLKDNDQGFSLIESLIAIVVLGVLMAGGLAFYYQASALYYRSLHTQMATWVADTEMEQVKGIGCNNATTDPGTQVSLTGNSADLSHLTGIRKTTWPNSPTQDPCLATTARPACASSTIVGECVTWTEPGSTANSSVVRLVTYVGP